MSRQSEPTRQKERGWPFKFRVAFHGLKVGLFGESSFHVHVVMAIAVVIVATVLRVPFDRWCVLLLCIAIVFSAEMMNTSIEWLARAVTDQQDSRVRIALDVASAAVLLAAIGSSVVGTLILGLHFGAYLGWWSAT